MPPLEETETQILINCAFCRGKGRDPFGIMSHLSRCYACQGKKTLGVAKPVKSCPYCQGTGVSPIGARNYCLVCRGRGIVTVPEPGEVCPRCGGSGGERSGLYCIQCKGKGVVSKKQQILEKGESRL